MKKSYFSLYLPIDGRCEQMRSDTQNSGFDCKQKFSENLKKFSRKLF